MGILSKILAGEISAPAEKTIPENSSAKKPAEICPNCKPPYGQHFWMDVFRRWHCTECDPPAAVSMVRDQVLLSLPNNAGGSTSDSNDWGLPGIQILGIRNPDGSWEFSPTTTQANRREMIEDQEFWDRLDARKKIEAYETAEG